MLETVMAFAASTPFPADLDVAWQAMHDRLIAQFPTSRRGPVRCVIVDAVDAPSFLDGLQTTTVREDPQLREWVARYGCLVVAMVDVQVGAA